MHNQNGKKDSNMMWMMFICCLLPIAIFFFAGGKLSSSGYFWPVLIGVFVVGHILMMFRGHGGHGDDDTERQSDSSESQSGVENDAVSEKQPETKDKPKHGGCCR